MTAARLVLASASPARLQTLQRAGVAPFVVVSDVDEETVVAAARQAYGDLAADEVTLLLARAKAEAVASVLESAEAPSDAPADAVVVGCDSMLELDGAVRGKPRDAAEAIARWQQMRGRTGVLHTGHWVIDLRDPGSGATVGAVASTTVHFAHPDDDEIAAYVATGEPLAVAGAFTVDGLGGAFVRGIEGDHHNVVGISLPLLRTLVADCGIRWVDLWAQPPA